MREITTTAGWKALVKTSEQMPVLVLKHSTRCPVSGAAYNDFLRFFEASPAGVEGAFVKVVENRAVSNAMAEDTGVRHESPQVYLLVGGRAVWHTSHHGITETALSQALNDLGA